MEESYSRPPRLTPPAYVPLRDPLKHRFTIDLVLCDDARAQAIRHSEFGSYENKTSTQITYTVYLILIDIQNISRYTHDYESIRSQSLVCNIT